MLQYIINMTAIWLLSLIVFDIFLSRENYHSYNRLYLMGTFVLGLVLPLWEWQDAGSTYTGIVHLAAPVMKQTADIKGSIENSNAAATMLNMETILWTVYFAGMAVFIVLIIREVISLVVTYKKGTKSKDGVWTIVTTGKQHSPYSAFRYVFISSKEDYTPEQLRIILTHEEQHGHMLHFFDLAFMQLAKIVFWFHPLVYMYAERLSIVHEFQADAAVDEAPKKYGQFLIEQAILKSAPALSHSFNRSPIKKRIVMLTHHSSALSKSKTLLIVPLALVCILCFSKNAFSDETKVKNGNKITYRGNTVEFREFPMPQPDTTIVVDPETGKEAMKISMLEGPNIKAALLNGERIYDELAIDSINRTGFHAFTYKPFLSGEELTIYLLSNMKQEFKELKDGVYYINIANLILNSKGKIVYFEVDSVASAYHEIAINMPLQKKIQNKIASILNAAPAYESACADKKHVPFVFRYMMGRPFTVKGGKVVKM